MASPEAPRMSGKPLPSRVPRPTYLSNLSSPISLLDRTPMSTEMLLFCKATSQEVKSPDPGTSDSVKPPRPEGQLLKGSAEEPPQPPPGQTHKTHRCTSFCSGPLAECWIVNQLPLSPGASETILESSGHSRGLQASYGRAGILASPVLNTHSFMYALNKR